jgi:hypothetical protein
MGSLLKVFLAPYATNFEKPLPIIGVRSTLISNQRGIKAKGASSNNWGQININLLAHSSLWVTKN